MIKIDKKIIGHSVSQGTPAPEVMHESLARPNILHGSSYKIKTPLSDHALYITINDIILNAGTPHEVRRPFEIFINSKAMDHFQWVVALTRIISAAFRKGGDCTFLVDELCSVFDPKGGYFKKGGKYMPSLVAEIGEVIEQHLVGLGLYERDTSLAVAAQAMLKEKTETLKTTNSTGQLCGKCGDYSVVLLDNCLTCTSCGASKCG